MKYLWLGLIVTLVLTTFMFASMTSAVFMELRDWARKGRYERRD